MTHPHCTDDAIGTLVELAIRMSGPGIAKTVPSEVEESKARARQRFAKLVAASGRSQREFAEELLDCDESAVRRAIKHGLSLPIPWWLDMLIKREPRLAARWLADALSDTQTALQSREATNG